MQLSVLAIQKMFRLAKKLEMNVELTLSQGEYGAKNKMLKY